MIPEPLSFTRQVRALERRIRDLETRGRNIADTGWLACTVTAGFAALADAPMARVRDGIVYVRGGFDSTGLTANANVDVGSLPAGVLGPSGTLTWMSGSNTPAAAGAVLISTVGTITLRLGSTVGAYYKLNGLCWPAN